MNKTNVSLQISPLSNFTKENRVYLIDQIKEIFFLSSSVKSFSSPEKKETFFKRWCGDYIEHYSHEFFLAHDRQKVLGYLSGCSDSNQSKSVLSVPGFLVFEDLFLKFPAHLHINFHPDARGMGLGSLLMEYYLNYLKSKKVHGVHLVTSPDAKNVTFYERLHFDFTNTRDLNGSSLYFMGRILD